MRGMIVGIGTDLCEVDRVAGALERSRERFLARVFTAREQAAAEGSAHPARAFASFFAIKESAFKTLRRGWPHGVGYLEIELERPEAMTGPLVLSGRAAALATEIGAGRLHAAATCDDEIAAAIVVAESVR